MSESHYIYKFYLAQLSEFVSGQSSQRCQLNFSSSTLKCMSANYAKEWFPNETLFSLTAKS